MTFRDVAADLISKYETTFEGVIPSEPEESRFIEDFVAEIPLPAASARTSLIRSLSDVLYQLFDWKYNTGEADADALDEAIDYPTADSILDQAIERCTIDSDRRDFNVSRMDRWLARPREQRMLLPFWPNPELYKRVVV